jgi:hypothetical protein
MGSSFFDGMNSFATLDVVSGDDGISCATIDQLAQVFWDIRGSYSLSLDLTRVLMTLRTCV